jgi:predicted nuclease of predicted toxin-antitoxin system
MRLMADEGVDRQIVARLRQEGHEVLYVAELDPGIDDSFVLERASQSGALLLTADKDFGELVFRQKKAPGGVVLLRLAGLVPDKKAQIVEAFLKDHGDEMVQGFSVISPGHLRIRKEP